MSEGVAVTCRGSSLTLQGKIEKAVPTVHVQKAPDSPDTFSWFVNR